MSIGMTIVALPSVEDRVMKISSEQVPHMTILFLGDQDDNPDQDRIIEFVEHVAETLPRFGMGVDHRGTLGPDDADVLFFEKSGPFYKDILAARDQMLLFDPIKFAYDSVEQYPEWTPHLTLGYPETPAKKDDSDYGITWVNFDRLAVWVDDYDGPEFLLKREPLEVTMSGVSSSAVERVLAHHGVKGMKWGVRRTVDSTDHATGESKSAYDPYPEETEEPTKSAHIQARKFLASDMNPTDSDKPVHPEDQIYNYGYTGADHKYADYSAGKMGNGIFYRKYDAGEKTYSLDDMSHDIDLTPEGKPTANRLKAYSKSEVQHDFLKDRALIHYGIKGMKWGVRRSRTSSSSSSTSSIKSLSSEELQARINRMNLEKQYKTLLAEQNKKKPSVVKHLLKSIGQRQLSRVANAAADLAVEEALKKIGAQTGHENVTEVAKRIKPKKKK